MAAELRRRGIDLGTADSIVGTSAGASVGAMLVTGRDLDSLAESPPEIKGNGLAQCDLTPAEHILTLSLEYLQGETWVNASSITGKGIPPSPPNYRPYEVSAACYAGLGMSV